MAATISALLDAIEEEEQTSEQEHSASSTESISPFHEILAGNTLQDRLERILIYASVESHPKPSSTHESIATESSPSTQLSSMFNTIAQQHDKIIISIGNEIVRHILHNLYHIKISSRLAIYSAYFYVFSKDMLSTKAKQAISSKKPGLSRLRVATWYLDQYCRHSFITHSNTISNRMSQQARISLLFSHPEQFYTHQIHYWFRPCINMMSGLSLMTPYMVNYEMRAVLMYDLGTLSRMILSDSSTPIDFIRTVIEIVTSVTIPVTGLSDDISPIQYALNGYILKILRKHIYGNVGILNNYII